MNRKPYDPDNKLSDKEYAKRVNTIQVIWYLAYLAWRITTFPIRIIIELKNRNKIN